MNSECLARKQAVPLIPPAVNHSSLIFPCKRGPFVLLSGRDTTAILQNGVTGSHNSMLGTRNLELTGWSSEPAKTPHPSDASFIELH